ncbi:MAG: radical SAM protein [Candidatus Moraniibacteriota bacterium]
MKKIVLVSLNMNIDIDSYTTKSITRFIPEGLLYLATPLLKAGYDVRICDMAKEKNLDFDADIFGITGLPNQLAQMKKITGGIRKNNPKAKIALGGPFISCAIKWLKDLLDFDVAIIGEAENAIVPILENLSKNSTTKKIVFANTFPKVTDFFQPALDLIELPWYLNGQHRIFNYSLPAPTINNLMLSRGCPNSCNFCCQPFGKKVRPLSHEHINFILESYAKAGAKSIRFQDDNWQYLQPKMTRYVLEKLSELGLQVAINSRVDDLTDDFMKNISRYEAIKQISFGVESLSQTSLRTTRKGTSVKQIKRVIKLCRQHNIEPSFFIIIGLPGENKSSIQAMTQLIKEERIFPQFYFLLPIPGTIYWDIFLEKYPAEKAFELFDNWDIKQGIGKKLFFNITDLSDHALQDYYSELKKIQKSFY